MDSLDHEDDGSTGSLGSDNEGAGERHYEFVNPNISEAYDGDEGSDEHDSDVAIEDPSAGYVVASSSGLDAIEEEQDNGHDEEGSESGQDVDQQGFIVTEPISVEASPRQPTAEDEDSQQGADGDYALPSISTEEIRQLVEMRLRQLQSEYNEVSGTAAPSAVGASGAEGSSGASAAQDEKAAKLARLRAALAAAREARNALGPAPQPVMDLAPGSDEFPEDYDEMQLADSMAQRQAQQQGGGSDAASMLALLSASTTAGFAGADDSAAGIGGETDFSDFQAAGDEAGAMGSLSIPAAGVEIAATDANSLPSAAATPGLATFPVTVPATAAPNDFDPFGSARGATTMTTSTAGAVVPSARGRVQGAAAGIPAGGRAVSPLPQDRKAEIASVMGRIRIAPRGRPSQHSELLVQAALRRVGGGQ